MMESWSLWRCFKKKWRSQREIWTLSTDFCKRYMKESRSFVVEVVGVLECYFSSWYYLRTFDRATVSTVAWHGWKLRPKSNFGIYLPGSVFAWLDMRFFSSRLRRNQSGFNRQLWIAIHIPASFNYSDFGKWLFGIDVGWPISTS